MIITLQFKESRTFNFQLISPIIMKAMNKNGSLIKFKIIKVSLKYVPVSDLQTFLKLQK